MRASFRPPFVCATVYNTFERERERGVKIVRDHFMERAHRIVRSIIVREIFAVTKEEGGMDFRYICLFEKSEKGTERNESFLIDTSLFLKLLSSICLVFSIIFHYTYTDK